jgi:hypothetical protein
VRRLNTAKGEPTATTLTSRLLPELFAGFDELDQITVLDLGAGNADTVDFLARYRVKIFFSDLLNHRVLAKLQAQTDIADLDDLIRQQLDIPANTTIDICLLWDGLHYLDLATMEALSRVMDPLLHDDSRGYGFGTLHGRVPPDSNRYGIAGTNSLIARTADQTPKYIPHSQQYLTNHFNALQISRATLLREGRLELLFEKQGPG